jgi:hypothetical protein
MSEKVNQENETLRKTDFRRSLSFRHRLGNVIQSFIGIAEDLTMILTFSSIMPKWTMKWILFRMGKGKQWFWD